MHPRRREEREERDELPRRTYFEFLLRGFSSRSSRLCGCSLLPSLPQHHVARVGVVAVGADVLGAADEGLALVVPLDEHRVAAEAEAGGDLAEALGELRLAAGGVV